MRPYDMIHKKRDGGELTTAEINWLIQGYTKGEIPDYQMAALAMAIYFRGMSKREIADLTMAMAHSGEMVDLSPIHGVKVDKHSTGGVADTVSLVVTPMVAAAGVPVAKMSGRGLGHTGGTIDKLESIPGFHVDLSKEAFMENVNRVGIAVIGQTADLAPADKKLYALRDVTATIDSIPLIASSVMSKKIAAGADAIVLDVKTGSGAFMKKEEDAIALAKTMVEIGKSVGRRTVAVVSDMDQPLGNAIGNALEVEEAIQILRGEITEGDLLEVSLTVGARMLVLAGKAADAQEARQKLIEIWQSKQAFHKMRAFFEAQGGDGRVVEDLSLLPQAAVKHPVAAPIDGYVQKIQAEEVGIAAMLLGAGRATKEDQIDLAVGIVLKKRLGDPVKAGEPFALLYANDPAKIPEAEQKLLEAYTFGKAQSEKRTLIHAVIE